MRPCDRAFPPPEAWQRKKVPTEEGCRRKTRWETLEEWKERVEKEAGPGTWEARQKWIKDHRWHPHQLRHNAATLVRQVMGLDAARALLGHGSMSVAEIYAEMDEKKAMQAAASLKIG